MFWFFFIEWIGGRHRGGRGGAGGAANRGMLDSSFPSDPSILFQVIFF